MERIEVHVVYRVTYTFPGLDDRCSAHGQSLCVLCARNPGSCKDGDSGGCGMWSATGMHWDTCPNRLKGPLEETP